MASVEQKHSNGDVISNDESSSRFDIQLVYDSLEKCCADCNALYLEHYIVAFKELYRFFTLLGSVFGFVASDIHSKVGILEEYLKSELSKEYLTIQSMIEYEIKENVTSSTAKPSGSRTLLRLHRSLEFIMSFMQDFGNADAEAKSSVLAQKCYKDTLAKYHPWLIQKGAHIAMYSLPARQQFIERVHGGACDTDKVQYYVKVMGNIATISNRVYDETQKLYEANGLLNLP